MRRLRNHIVGVDQGSEIMFSDFGDNGPMWAGEGPREARLFIKFSEPFDSMPAVQVSMSMWDTDGDTNQRADLRAEAITENGFELVFRTWGNSRVARVRGEWLAIGELRDSEDWQLY